jgi:hypothetical protein
MALTLTGTGGVFTRLGKIFYAEKMINLWRGGTSADQLWKEIRDILAEFAVGTDSQTIQQVVAALPQATLTAQGNLNAIMSSLRTVAQDVLIQMADEDNPLPAKTIGEAIEELIVQMVAASATVDANEPSGTISTSGVVSAASKGDAEVSLVDGRGNRLEFAYDEIINMICSSIAAPTKPSFTVKGESAQSDRLYHNWPLGSGVSGSVTAVDAADTTQNKLTNGTFDTITSNVPNNWTLEAGTAGVDLLEETTTVLKSGKSLEIVGGGANVRLVQNIASVVSHHTQYFLALWARTSGTPTGGNLIVDLHDGSAVITDEAGSNNTITQVITSLSTTFALVGTFFRIKDPKPSVVNIRIRVEGFTGSASLFLDHMSLSAANQLYLGGPFVGIASGGTDFELDDKITLNVSNAYAGDFQTYFHRNFDMVALGKRLPSATGGAETINDNLIA